MGLNRINGEWEGASVSTAESENDLTFGCLHFFYQVLFNCKSTALFIFCWAYKTNISMYFYVLNKLF